MRSKESSEDHPSGRVLNHISGGQLNAFQFRSTAFGDLDLKRKAQQRIACVSFFLPVFVTWLYKYLEAGGVWQEGASQGTGAACLSGSWAWTSTCWNSLVSVCWCAFLYFFLHAILITLVNWGHYLEYVNNLSAALAALLGVGRLVLLGPSCPTEVLPQF